MGKKLPIGLEKYAKRVKKHPPKSNKNKKSATRRLIKKYNN
jgi:hypothetical protein